jgi:transcriptional regulator with XRE-family HTH domain
MGDLATELAKRKGDMSQEEFARYLGISQSYVSELLAGKRTASVPIAAIAIVSKYPDLASLFFPPNIAMAIKTSLQRLGEATT